MIILAIRTDKPEAELHIYEDTELINSVVWEAHRQLTDTIHIKIKELLNKNGKAWNDINAVVVFKGPGSFTGLRIGISVANALALGLSIPVVAQGEEDWLQAGIARLSNGEDEKIAMPFYGADANITLPKK
jgi:tRNA threonylcarbamoyladenosine biosynthesis protein TsaB